MLSEDPDVACGTHRRLATGHRISADVVLLKQHTSIASSELPRTWYSGYSFPELTICESWSLNRIFHTSSLQHQGSSGTS